MVRPAGRDRERARSGSPPVGGPSRFPSAAPASGARRDALAGRSRDRYWRVGCCHRATSYWQGSPVSAAARIVLGRGRRRPPHAEHRSLAAAECRVVLLAHRPHGDLPLGQCPDRRAAPSEVGAAIVGCARTRRQLHLSPVVRELARRDRECASPMSRLAAAAWAAHDSTVHALETTPTTEARVVGATRDPCHPGSIFLLGGVTTPRA